MGFFGFLLIIIGLGLFFGDPIIEKATNGKIDLISNNKRYFLWIPVLLGSVMMVNPLVYNADGERTYVQDPIFKTEKIVFEPGYTWGGFLHRQTEWPDVMSTVLEDVPIRFNDATQASANANVRWELPKDEESMIALHKAYRSPDKLQDRTLKPYSTECLGFSSQLMESETHYSGGQSKLKEDFRNQLLNGQYVLETKTDYKVDSLTGEHVKITDVDLRKGKDGRILTIPSDVQNYGIRAVFAAVPQVDYEPIVDKKLQAKIDQSTKESIAKQTLITAQQEALTEKARGEQLLAKTRAEEEASKLQAVIQAQKEKEVARENALQAKFIADKIEQEGRAQAEANRALVAAGPTPEQKIQLQIEIARVTSENLAKATTPKIVIMNGGGSSGTSNVMDVFGAERTLELINKMADQ